MKAYKGFDPDMTCRGKQYEENTVYEEDTAKICESGMHYCRNPFDVLNYYDLVNEDGKFNTFAEVEPLDEELTDDDKKFCTKKLRIGAKLSFAGFIKACVEFVCEKTINEMPNKKTNVKNNDTIVSKANYAKIGSSGYCAQIGSSGDYAQIGSSGNYAHIGSSGDCAQIGSSGNSAKIGSSGYCAQIGSSGNCAQIGSSGNSAQIGSSGYCAQIGSSGDCARITSEGDDSIICCAGCNSIVSAKVGSWITLSEWGHSDEKNRIVPKCVKTEYVDGKKIKADTPYKLENGKFVEVESEEN